MDGDPGCREGLPCTVRAACWLLFAPIYRRFCVAGVDFGNFVASPSGVGTTTYLISACSYVWLFAALSILKLLDIFNDGADVRLDEENLRAMRDCFGLHEPWRSLAIELIALGGVYT